VEEEAFWLPESDPHDLAAKRRDAETPKQRVTTILATAHAFGRVRGPRMSRFDGSATEIALGAALTQVSAERRGEGECDNCGET